MKWGPWIMNQFRTKKIMRNLRIVPIANIILIPKINRRHILNFMVALFVIFPIFGYFRHKYVVKKMSRILIREQQALEVQLKQSLNKFDLRIPAQTDYMIVAICQKFGQGDQFTKQDEQNCRKLFQFNQEVINSTQSQDFKWILLGNPTIIDIMKKQQATQSNWQFHEREQKGRQFKIYLLAREIDDSEKIIMDWNIGVPLSVISKHIAKHRYKKYLKSVNF